MGALAKQARREATAAIRQARTQAAERAAEFKRLRGEPDRGFERTSFDEAGIDALNLAFERAQSDLEERLQQQQAASGFGIQRGGPFVGMAGRETQRLLGQRAGVESGQRFKNQQAEEVNRQQWQKFVLSGGGNFGPIIQGGAALGQLGSSGGGSGQGIGQLVGTLGGAGIGFALGGPPGAMLGASLGGAAGGSAGGLIGGRGSATGGSINPNFFMGGQNQQGGFPFGSIQGQPGTNFVRAPFS